MTKEFVSYEIAFELKELGFDEPCFGYYEDDLLILCYDSKQEYELLLNCTAPLYQQAFRWFREKHRLASWIYNSHLNVFFYTILKNGRFIKGHDKFDTYEEAELACIIKLIDIFKSKKD
jgi:hypothetical protein